MEIADRTKERSTVILAVLTLVVIGLTLLASTLQTFRHQREAEEQHLFLTTRAVLLSIESSVRRNPVRQGEKRLAPQTAEFFQALEQNGDVLFVGIVNEREDTLLTSPLHGNVGVELPDAMLRQLREQGEWHGHLVFAGRSAYIYGKRLKPLPGLHISLRADLGPPGFLVVGLDTEQSLRSYTRFRKNVLFQALFILAAVLCTWALGFSFLSRREQAKKAVALENFQAKLLDNLPDGLITVGQDSVVRSANPAALRIFRREARDVLGKPVDSLPTALPVCSFDANPCQQTSWRQIDHGGARLEVLALPLADKEERACLLIIRDRTQLHSLEKSLADAEKLAAVGALAAGVAHEVRNPLSSLRGFAQYFVKKLSGRMPEEEYAKTMVREADRLNRVISDLLFLGRPKAISPRQVDLERLVRDITALLRFDLELKNVCIELQLEAGQVFADQDALKQALLNLLLNSLEALENSPSGKHAGSGAAALPDTRTDALEQTTRFSPEPGDPPDREAPEPAGLTSRSRLGIVSGRSDSGVWIEVRDAGRGMTAEQKQQAFEAFFTAREHGTGLGLALVQRTMLDHGGTAEIASEPGKGCVVRLFFPDEGAALLPAKLPRAPHEAAARD